ncbi:MAG: O-antigen ligase family protein, partial [Desulfobacterota bacterium]|nr:O-antigen ligase family protein [Thermodesulfobacteriota bacterium]
LRLSTPLFATWLVASAVWGPYFLAIRVPGLFDITIERILFGCVLFILAIGLCTGQLMLRTNITLEVFMLFFVCVCLASMTLHGFTPELPEFPSPWNIFITGYLFPFIVFVFAKQYLAREPDITMVVRVLFFLGCYLAITAFFEFANMRQFVVPRYINDPNIWLHYERARGPFLNAAFNGTALLIGCACGVHVVHMYKPGIIKVCFGLLLFLFLPAFFFTQTRSVYLGAVILAILLFFLYKTRYPKWKAWALPITLALVFIMANAPRLASEERRSGGVLQTIEVEQRLGLIKRSTLMFFDRPFLGVGLAQFIPASLKEYQGKVAFFASFEALTQHNHILGMMVELGLIGTLLYLIIIIIIFKRLFHLLRILPAEGFVGRNLAATIICVWVVYLNNNFFVEPSYCLFVNVVPFMFAGIADGLYTRFAQMCVQSA